MADNTYKYLQTLIRMGSFSRAAHELAISQPSLSQFIQRLESDAGVELVDRSTKPLQLTYAGQCYLKTEGEILRLREERDKLISDLADGTRGCIRVGASPYRAMFFLTSVLPEFRKRYSNVQVKLVEGRSHQLEVSAVQGDADFSIVLLPLDLPELEYQELYTERMLIALPRCSPLSDQVVSTTNEFEPMDFRLLDKHPFIVIKKSAKVFNFITSYANEQELNPRLFWRPSHRRRQLRLQMQALVPHWWQNQSFVDPLGYEECVAMTSAQRCTVVLLWWPIVGKSIFRRRQRR